MNEEQVIDILRAGLHPDAGIRVERNNNKFLVRLVSDEFAGMSTVQRHQKIYQLLADPIRHGDIHAVSIQAWTTQEQSQAQ